MTGVPPKPFSAPPADAGMIDLIRSGAETWNSLRKAHPTALLNLSGLDLSGMDLSSFDLHDAVLDSTNLTRANLRNANLDRAKLPFAILEGADLSEAHASGAFFYAVQAT